MLSPNANFYVNQELRRFSVEKGNLTTAVNNDQKADALATIRTMSELLMHIRASVRNNMDGGKH